MMLTSKSPVRSKGFSLIEIMVGLVIGLIATVVIFQVFSVSEGYKRTTTSGGDAQTSGALATFSLERDLRQAGYGINTLDFLGCPILYWDALGVPPFPPLNLVPVEIIDGISGAPDSITLLYGNSDLIAAPATLIEDMPSASAVYKVNNRYGFSEGDLVIVAEPGKDCTLAQVSNLPSQTGKTSNVIHNSGNYTNEHGQQVPTRYNNPSGLGVKYNKQAKVFNIGSLPTRNTYAVSNGQLTLTQTFSSAVGAPVAQPIFDGVVQMQAEYGKDTSTPADGVVDVFNSSQPADTDEWKRVLAVRLVIVTRSTQYEKDAVGPAEIVYWPEAGSPKWTLSAEERHYRYKVFRTTVPIRNMIWTPA